MTHFLCVHGATAEYPDEICLQLSKLFVTTLWELWKNTEVLLPFSQTGCCICSLPLGSLIN